MILAVHIDPEPSRMIKEISPAFSDEDDREPRAKTERKHLRQRDSMLSNGGQNYLIKQ